MTDEDRVTCNTCRHLKAGWCHNAVLAQLHRTAQRAEVGPQLRALLQRCAGFTPIAQPAAIRNNYSDADKRR